MSEAVRGTGGATGAAPGQGGGPGGGGAGLLASWLEILRTQNLAPGRPMDPVSRWLLITRASVFPMTLLSGAIGGLLALAGPHRASFDGLSFGLAVVGILVAHAANNMINDYFDVQGGVDSAGYVRGQYAPHPILDGLISKRGLLVAIAAANVLDLGILLLLAERAGWPVAVFALLGLFISVFYVAPPVRLKHRGLGEPGVAVVWGPLMIGGTYFASTGHFEPSVLAASVPYALLVTSVLIGKHIDKLSADQSRGIRTLPVILGEARARFLNQYLMASFFLLVPLLVLTGTLGVATLGVLAALPRAIRVIRVAGAPRPQEAPPNFPIWPLWYVAWAFVLTRLAGGLLVLGLVVDAIWPIRL